MTLEQVNWGSVPDWLAGAGSVMALIFAFYAVRAAHRTNVQQGLQLKALEEDRIQAQASKVAVWCIENADKIPSCRVRNASELPIFDVVVCIAVGDMGSEHGDWWWRFQAVDSHVVPPGTIDVEFDRVGLDDHVAIPSRSAALYFRDAHGKYWRRNVKGVLEEWSIDRERVDRATIMQGNRWNVIPPETTASDALEGFWTEQN